jgi:hypothetical protein
VQPTIGMMIDKHFIGTAQQLSAWIVVVVVLISFWGSADKHRRARLLQDGAIEFAPNRRSYWAWPLVVGYLIYATVRRLMHIHPGWLNLDIAVTLGGLAVLLAFPFPGKIIVTSDGLEQVSWLWKNKRIRWEDIVEINTGETSRTVTITAVDRTKIIHGPRLPDGARLLTELKHQCSENLPADFPREPSPVGQETDSAF